MKRLLLLGFLLIALSGKIFAQSDVSFFCQDGLKFWVIINGIKQNDAAQTNVKVSGLSASNYKAKIIFENNTIPAIEKTIYTKDADGKFFSMTYGIKKDKNGSYVMRLNSMDENVVTYGDQYSTPLIITEGPATVQTNQSYTTTTISTNENRNSDGGSISVNAVDPITGEGINLNMSVNAGNNGVGANGVVTTTTTTTTTTHTTTNNSGYQENVVVNNQPDHYIMQGYNGRIGCPWPMSGSDFQSAKNSIASKSFDDTRLTIAKQVTSANCLFCSQVKEIMMLFSFESTKLDFAKFAYNYVYDQGNYFKLNDAFTFESSIDELNGYINGNR